MFFEVKNCLPRQASNLHNVFNFNCLLGQGKGLDAHTNIILFQAHCAELESGKQQAVGSGQWEWCVQMKIF